MEQWRIELYQNELYHHGILGMKWGKRNGPPYPLGASDHSSSEKKAGYKKSLGGGRNEELYDRLKKTKNKVGKAVQDVYRDSYRDNYNLSKEDAEAAAKKRVELMKKVAIGAGIGAAVVGGVYAANYLRGKNWTDQVIKAGTTIQTLSADPQRLEKGKSFFTNFKEVDKRIYEGSFSRAAGGGFKKIIEANVNKDINVAGPKAGKKAFQELMRSDPQFKKDYQIFEKNYSHLTGINGYRKGYDLFNAKALALDGNTRAGNQVSAMQDKFYDLLKSKGYGGVIDVNDTKYSNLRGHSPTIIFDKSNLGETKIKEMNLEKVLKGHEVARKEIPKIKKANPDSRQYAMGYLAVSSSLGGMVLGGYDAKVQTDQMMKEWKEKKESKKKKAEKKKEESV